MPVEKHPIGARHAESGPSVLALLKDSLSARGCALHPRTKD